MTPAQRYAAAVKASRSAEPKFYTSARGLAAWVNGSGHVVFWAHPLSAQDVPAFIVWLRATFEEPAP